LLPPFALALVGVIAALVVQRKQKPEPNQTVRGAIIAQEDGRTD